MIEWLTLIDTYNKVIGKASRKEIHLKGLKHRGFVILLKNSKGQILIQKRSSSKDMCPGCWDVSVAGHPLFNESYEQAAKRRMKEELGINADVKLKKIFEYKVVQPPYTDNELCALFESKSNAKPIRNPKEFSEIKFIDLNILKKEVNDNTKAFTPWLKIALEIGE